MEKQLIFRSVGQNMPFMMVTAGEIVDGQFRANSGDLPFIMDDCNLPGGYIRKDEMFGSDPFIARKDLHDFFAEVYHCGRLLGVEFYDGFMVLKFACSDEVEKETSEKE